MGGLRRASRPPDPCHPEEWIQDRFSCKKALFNSRIDEGEGGDMHCRWRDVYDRFTPTVVDRISKFTECLAGVVGRYMFNVQSHPAWNCNTFHQEHMLSFKSLRIPGYIEQQCVLGIFADVGFISVIHQEHIDAKVDLA